MKKRRKRRAVDKKRLFAVSFAFILCVYVIGLFCLQQMDINHNRIAIAEIDTEILAEQNRCDELQRQKSLIDTPEYKERVARERGGLVRPDEIIFVDPLEK